MKLNIIAVLLLAALAARTSAQTAFTYQGELNQGGNLANGVYDMRFKLFEIGGTLVGATQCVNNVNVAGGRFTTTVDFGQQFASTAARFIEIEVRQDTGLSCAITTGYTVLSPRQSVLPTPRASAATVANSLATPSGFVLVNLTNTGNIGVGTAVPTSQLHLSGASDALKVTASTPFVTLTDASSSNARVQMQNSLGRYFVMTESFLNNSNPGAFTVVSPQGWFGVGTQNPAGPLDVASGNQSYVRVNTDGDLRVNGGTDGFFGIFNEGVSTGSTLIFGQGVARLTVANTGNVGIGTLTPQAKLDVNGSIQFAPTFGVKSIHGTSFLPYKIGGVLGGSYGEYDESGMVGHGAIGHKFIAPVELPNGCTVTRIDLTFVDDRPADITLTFGRTSLSSGAIITSPSLVTSGVSNAVRTQGVDFAGIGINNNINVYWLRADLQSLGSSVHKIIGVRITYTVTSPVP